MERLKIMIIRMKVLLPLLLLTLIAAPRAHAAEPPSIILIMLDDMGPADLGCYGSKAIATPNLDRLAREGMRFTQAYAGCSVCAPTRSTLMTGMHMGKTTVRANPGGVPLRDEDMTIAEVLKPAGYVCGGFGKWGIGDVDTPGVPEKQGFDRFFGYYHQVHAHSYYPEFLIDTGRKFPLADGIFSAYPIFDEMKKFIRENKDRRFFCYAPWTLPHGRYEIPETDPAWQMYKDKPWSADEKGHAAYCTLADRFVGETLALLEELKLDEKTIILFCSDNGAPNRSEILNSSGGLRGQKGELYEGGIRTPLIVRWPGRIKPAATSDPPVYHPDILPTLAQVANADSPADIDGVSLLPELLGSGEIPRERHLYWEWNGGHFAPYEPKYQAVRRGRWKIVRHELAGEWELYDLQNDRNETTNLAADHPKTVAELSAWVDKNRRPHQPQIEPEKTKGQRWRTPRA